MALAGWSSLPLAGDRQHGDRGGRKLAGGLLARGGVAVADEQLGEIADARVVTDEHDARDLIVEASQPIEQVLDVGRVEVAFDLDLGVAAERGTYALERFARATRRRAEHEIGTQCELHEVIA